MVSVTQRTFPLSILPGGVPSFTLWAQNPTKRGSFFSIPQFTARSTEIKEGERSCDNLLGLIEQAKSKNQEIKKSRLPNPRNGFQLSSVKETRLLSSLVKKRETLLDSLNMASMDFSIVRSPILAATSPSSSESESALVTLTLGMGVCSSERKKKKISVVTRNIFEKRKCTVLGLKVSAQGLL